MKFLFIFSMLPIVVLASAYHHALQVAQDIIDGVAANIPLNNSDAIASYYSEDFRFKQCDGKELDRAGTVAKMLERRIYGLPNAVFLAAKDLDRETVIYKLEEHFSYQPPLSTSNIVKKVNGKWVLTTGEITGCR